MLIDSVANDRGLLVDAADGRTVTAGDIRARAGEVRAWPRGVAFHFPDGSTASIAWFLALVEAGYPVALVDPGLEARLVAGLVDRYQPDVIIDVGETHVAGLVAHANRQGRQPHPGVWCATSIIAEPHPQLSVLLGTSGSTGAPKMVRLSANNIRSNAEQIVRSLSVKPDDRSVTTLPLFYSFGMSVITSHALAGASVLVTRRTVLEPPFWEELSRFGVTFLPGVPITFEMLARLGVEKRLGSAMRAMIQAGGRLRNDLIAKLHGVMTGRGGEFFVMYGQTEASPRMACLPSSRLPEKLGSAGIALPGSEIWIAGQGGRRLSNAEPGEVMFAGPNVMMGYAESRADLHLGDVQGGLLQTGDLGFLDADGCLFLTGRAKRIAKLAGVRIALGDIEALAVEFLPAGAAVAAVSSGDGIAIFIESSNTETAAALRKHLALRLTAPPRLIAIHLRDALPRLGNGKIAYPDLERAAAS